MGRTHETGNDAPMPPADDQSRSRDLDTYYAVLADRRRRILIDVLDAETSVDLDRATTAINALEADEESTDRIELSLLHKHVPLLVDAGIAEFDAEDRRLVANRSEVEFLSNILEYATA